MSFLYNWGWLGLLVPLTLLVSYRQGERNDNVDTIEWGDLDVFQSTVQVASQKWRHITATLLTLSMVAVTVVLLVGLLPGQQDVRNQDLCVLVVDVSESANTSPELGGITRLEQYQGVIPQVFAGEQSCSNVSMISFGGGVDTLVAAGPDSARIQDTVGSLDVGLDGSVISEAVRDAVETCTAFNGGPEFPGDCQVIVMSDGEEVNAGEDRGLSDTRDLVNDYNTEDRHYVTVHTIRSDEGEVTFFPDGARYLSPPASEDFIGLSQDTGGVDLEVGGADELQSALQAVRSESTGDASDQPWWQEHAQRIFGSVLLLMLAAAFYVALLRQLPTKHIALEETPTRSGITIGTHPQVTRMPEMAGV